MIQRMYCIIPEVSQEFGSEININAKDAIKDSEWKEAMDWEISSKKMVTGCLYRDLKKLEFIMQMEIYSEARSWWIGEEKG